MNSANLLTLTPLIPAGPSLAEELRFYTEQLGFTVTWQAGNMAGIRRGSIEFNLIENTNREWADNASFSIGVDDLDALYDEYKNSTAKGSTAKSSTAKIGPLEMKAWGRREFHLIAPSGVCYQFYQREI